MERICTYMDENGKCTYVNTTIITMVKSFLHLASFHFLLAAKFQNQSL